MKCHISWAFKCFFFNRSNKKVFQIIRNQTPLERLTTKIFENMIKIKSRKSKRVEKNGRGELWKNIKFEKGELVIKKFGIIKHSKRMLIKCDIVISHYKI